MQDKRDLLVYIELFEQRIQKAPVLDEGIRAGAAGGQLLRVAHADKIGRNTASQFLQMRKHITPEVGRRGIAVQEHDRGTFAYLDISHALSQDIHTLLGIRELCTDHDTTLPFFFSCTPQPLEG